MDKAKEISALWEQIKPQIGEMIRLCCEVEDHAEVTADAYQRGYENGFIAGHLKAEKSGQSFYEDGYQRGLNDAWECMKKIAFNPESVECIDDLVRMGFDVGTADSWSEAIELLFEKYSASECIEKIRQYEQEQEEIKVGDEVNAPFGKAIVVNIDSVAEKIWLVYADGYGGFVYFKDAPTKTGRHFPEIAEVFAKMKETDNG